MTDDNKPKRKKLTRVIVNEISSVDVGANPGAKVMLVKRGEPTGKAARKLAAQSLFTSVAEIRNDTSGNERSQLLAKTFEQFDTYIKDQQMQKIEKLLDKKHGATKIAKRVVEDGAKVNEADFLASVMKHALADRRPLESEAQAFSRVYDGQTEEGMQIRKAHAIIKGFPTQDLSATQVGGDDATAVDNPTSAIAQLQAMAAKMRKKSPAMSFAQAFAVIAADTRNAALLAAAINADQVKADVTQR